MGQRLVITIRGTAVDGPIVNVYKHWSAYTGSAIEETNGFIDAYNAWMDEHPNDKFIFARNDQEAFNRQKEILAMVMMNAWPGAHPAGFKNDVEEVDEEDDPEAAEKYAANVKMLLMSMGMMELASKLDDKFSYDRNEGLIGITSDGMSDYASWSEGDVDIYIDRKGNVNEVYFGVMWGNTYEDELAECIENGESEADLLDTMYETDIVNNDDFGAFSIDGWYEFCDVCDKAWADSKYRIGSKKENSVWSFIE